MAFAGHAATVTATGTTVATTSTPSPATSSSASARATWATASATASATSAESATATSAAITSAFTAAGTGYTGARFVATRGKIPWLHRRFRTGLGTRTTFFINNFKRATKAALGAADEQKGTDGIDGSTLATDDFAHVRGVDTQFVNGGAVAVCSGNSDRVRAIHQPLNHVI
jgi:hypothetical protein